jgi:uncharacterized membrane protein
MRTAASGKPETPAAENIDSILRLEKQDERTLAVHHRFFHWIGWFVGTIQFVALQCAFVLCWVVVNLYLTHQTFDEYPFPLLAGILALEAVLLTSCVLIRQSVIDRTLERRDLAPKFYPVLSSPLPLDLPCWAVGATGAGAEPSA